jgi:hypothetical protein
VLAGLSSAAAFRDAPWASVDHLLPEAVVLPCPARSWDGRTRWLRWAEGVTAVMTPADEGAPIDWVTVEASAPSRHDQGVTAVSRDGLPLIGAVPGFPVFVLHGGSGLETIAAVAGARWVVAAAVDGHDECPALLRASRDCSDRPA